MEWSVPLLGGDCVGAGDLVESAVVTGGKRDRLEGDSGRSSTFASLAEKSTMSFVLRGVSHDDAYFDFLQLLGERRASAGAS